MALFRRDQEFGGLRLDEEFPLTRVDHPKIREESEDFVILKCKGVVARDVPTSQGAANKVAFVVARFSDPAKVFEVNTFASAIVDKVEEALDEARGDEAEAFSDLPAIACLQRVQSSHNEKVNALVLCWRASLDMDPRGAEFMKGVKAAAKAGDVSEDDIPF